jgi:hypothetical protein
MRREFRVRTYPLVMREAGCWPPEADGLTATEADVINAVVSVE